ncbi:hypothetical protein GcC1_132021 [Golovinomyces cichoracearum]|uniref:Uncharacterized protein n=1 Tax=Golovinomyces cichoracearum TaxID=62708 RepID=A0A420I3X3_9PEZI|nr:hypothetical protein GcC1_132021 [Golovinomyces cichoracearum]
MLQENTTLLISEQTRTKQEHIKAIALRIKFMSESHAASDGESIRGMADKNKRYLTQSTGDTSRISRIVSSCVYQDPEGWIGIRSKDGFHETVKSALDTTSGNAAVRGISYICACAQQVALDPHRVSKDSLPLHYMISDLINAGGCYISY